MNDDIRKKAADAGQKAIAFKNMGYHCSESVFLAINDTLNITDPAMVRIITGFHGGGGTHRTEPGVNLTELLARIASGTEDRPDEEIPLEQVGHLCGAVAAGLACIGFLYGRKLPTDDLTCVDELCYELHQRFMHEFGQRECYPLREKWIPVFPEGTCEPVYKRGAEIAVELILDAANLVPECAKKD